MMKKLLIFVAASLLGYFLKAQNEGKITIGHIDTHYSGALQEKG